MEKPEEKKRSLRGPRRRREDNIKWILKKYDEVVRSGFIWLRIWTSGAYF
jgi:hypothetical protein